ncbi:hypothetical protein A5870_003243 [Enterococcus sp. 2G9_DIV0600]|nr:hypothetical protein A5870_003243 [Enterococcus sp. 2G9_DIV0600]
MEIKKMIFDFIYSNESNSRYVHIAIEKLVSIMMEDYIDLIHIQMCNESNSRYVHIAIEKLVSIMMEDYTHLDVYKRQVMSLTVDMCI